MDLKKLRQRIDALDERIVGLLNDRARVSLEIGHASPKNVSCRMYQTIGTDHQFSLAPSSAATGVSGFARAPGAAVVSVSSATSVGAGKSSAGSAAIPAVSV